MGGSNSIVIGVFSFCCWCLCRGIDFIYTYEYKILIESLKAIIWYELYLVFGNKYNPYDFVAYVLNYYYTALCLSYGYFFSEHVNNLKSLFSNFSAKYITKDVWSNLLAAKHLYVSTRTSAPTNWELNGHIESALKYVIGNETYFTAFLSFIDWFIISWFALFIYLFICDFLTTSIKNGKVVDKTFLNNQTTVLPEERLSSFEKKLFYIVFFFSTLGWFFYYNFFAVLQERPSLYIWLWFLPVMVLFLLYIPYKFIRIFGTSFNGNLEATGADISAFADFLFGITFTVALFLRFLIQGVRLLLILFIYASWHYLWVVNGCNHLVIYENESFLMDLNSVEFSLGSVSYFVFFKIPFWILYLFFEVIYIFFVITDQFFNYGFLTMVFWLFFFLHTCFTVEVVGYYVIDFLGNFKI